MPPAHAGERNDCHPPMLDRTRHHPQPSGRSSDAVSTAGLAGFALCYALFIVYGSLLPFDYQPQPLNEALAEFSRIRYLELGVASRADWVANILLYVPLAFSATGALALATGSRALRVLAAVLVVASCVALAFAVEFAQQFFPPRTVSQNDLIAETMGTLLGVAAWFAIGPRLLGLWQQFRDGGATAWRAVLALYVLAYAALSFFPYDVLVSSAELAEKMSNPARSGFVFAGSCGGALVCSVKLITEVALAAPLGALLGLAFPALGIGGALMLGLAAGLAIEVGQLLLASGVSQGSSVLTRGLGVAWGLALQRSIDVGALTRHRALIRTLVVVAAPAYMVLVAVLNGFSGAVETNWAAADKLAGLRFLPFYYHYYTSETAAMWSLLSNAGAYAVVGLVAWLLWPTRRMAWQSGVVAVLLALAIEVLKLYTPGKRPDPTNVLIAFATAWLANAVLVHLTAAMASVRGNRAMPEVVAMPRRGLAIAALVTFAGAGLLGLLVASPHTEAPVDESTMAQLPPGSQLPPVSLPDFRYAHPRLPHPTLADVARLKAVSDGYLAGVRRLAARGRAGADGLHARTLLEFIDPGSQDLNELHAQLMSTTFSWRGHGQVRPLAVAYDWLYDRWSEAQRAQLRDKLAQGCEYLVEFIRKDRLSPYNVYLYNAPFQALVACAIVLYGDDPRGEPVMRFTHDLWKNRVLPVWRQVMGANGGWHEGGEYVGIGIGGAVYHVPAMWRAATGEDLFATEPGIRGFLDFLVHRTQPDGTHLRIGDGSHFNRTVPDQVPLAIEFRHAAAYSLQTRNRLMPTSWPWGPLTDDSLVDRTAVSRLPTSIHFDGIGWVVARSDWSPEATYITFKAGNNYWSHSHLDQGSFTIFKGGGLALDSGANYGAEYGSDHHLNYSYQTIAHNTITVTDPQDTVPIPAARNETPRSIANDGGQRRVGSGWGVEAAPLDLAEWQAKRDIYETGRIVRYGDRDGITVAVSDITPAYTNALSGKGTFSHRTRRVERVWRVFTYDRVDDVVVVYDEVVATTASFRKRWLLHTESEPVVQGRRFVAEVAPGRGPGRGGGRLQGEVLLPRAATWHAVGGPGFEFYVDGRNYDEGGKLAAVFDRDAPHRSEPGRWRLELMPDADAATDHFLVVLLPSRLGERAPHGVRLIEEGGRFAAEVTGPRRTVRYWFRPGELGAEVEVTTAGSLQPTR
jgi:VanZ family protein